MTVNDLIKELNALADKGYGDNEIIGCEYDTLDDLHPVFNITLNAHLDKIVIKNTIHNED